MNEILVPIDKGRQTIEVIKGPILKAFIKQNLETKIMNYDSIVDSAMNTIAQFTTTDNGIENYIKVGLAFGRVQSGKTTYFLCTTACALDNDYDIVFLLSGVTNNLLEQNKSRLKGAFKLSHRYLTFFNSADFDTSVDEIITDIDSTLTSFSLDNLGGGVVVTVLKNDRHLAKIKAIVKHFKDKRILIIDDEGDQFSLNTKVNISQESRIFSLIRSIVYMSERTSLLTVTATPQAPLFADIYNALSPDFVEVIEPGIGYCGLETFHSNNNSIELITGDKDKIDFELLDAVVYFLFAIYESEFHSKEKYKNCKNWMLIHNSRLTSVHLKDYKELNNILEYDLKGLSNSISIYDSLDISQRKLKKHIQKLYDDFNIKKKFNFLFEDFFNKFDLVLKMVYISENNSNIKIINSRDYDKTQKLQLSKCGILIGGDMLGRGITIDGLTVSFFTRTKKSGKENIDTILQRARWFGYREKTLDLVRIFTTPEIQQRLQEVYLHDVSLYDELKYCVDNDIPLKDSKLPTSITKNLQPTRPNVIKKGSLWRSKKSKFIQQRNLNCGVEYEIYNEINQNIIDYLRTKTFSKEIKGIKRYEVNSKEFLSVIYPFINTSEIRDINTRLYEGIESLLNENEKVSLLILKEIDEISDGYSLSLNKNFDNYNAVYTGNVLVGSNQNDYEGDSYHFNKIDHIQIHFTRIKEDRNLLYTGNKVLFMCVNNRRVKEGETIRRK